MQSVERQSKFGIISSILAILTSVLWFTFVVIFIIITKRNINFGLDSGVVAVILIYGGGLVMAGLTFLLTVAGMVLGFLALRRGEPKRFFAIAGLVINFLWLMPYCVGIVRVFAPLDS